MKRFLIFFAVSLTLTHSAEGRNRDEPETGVDWKSLARQSANFLVVEHAFRLATEPGTREGMRGPFFGGYADAVRSLHGWADGDPFLVNYIGHPLMGAVGMRLFQQNDRRYKDVVFGKDRDYWRGQLRAAAFTALYSAQFEIGPFSEATVGKVQRTWPQHGLADMVVTPAIGFGWSLVEDSLDRFVVMRIENWTQNNWVRLLVRGGLNPSRSMSNMLAGRVPWHRDNRGSVYLPPRYVTRKKVEVDPAARDRRGVAPIEFQLNFTPQYYAGTGAGCLGGSAVTAVRLADNWQMVADVGGCKMAGLGPNLSGDSLHYLVGPRWKAATQSRLIPHVQFLAGGHRITGERFYPDRWEAIADVVQRAPKPAVYRSQYVTRDLDNAFLLAAGGGVDWRLNRAIELRLASVQYRYSWMRPVQGISFDHGLQFSSGLVLNMGTW